MQRRYNLFPNIEGVGLFITGNASPVLLIAYPPVQDRNQMRLITDAIKRTTTILNDKTHRQFDRFFRLQH